jgi:hypothetical protein
MGGSFQREKGKSMFHKGSLLLIVKWWTVEGGEAQIVKIFAVDPNCGVSM